MCKKVNTLKFDTPPERNDDMDPEIIKKLAACVNPDLVLKLATCGPPATTYEAAARILSAGNHPKKLIGTVWETVEQFSDYLKQSGWLVEIKHEKKYGLHPKANDVVIKSTSHQVRFLVVSDNINGYTYVACATVTYSSDDEWRKEVNA
jgi:hypothetical protein